MLEDTTKLDSLFTISVLISEFNTLVEEAKKLDTDTELRVAAEAIKEKAQSIIEYIGSAEELPDEDKAICLIFSDHFNDLLTTLDIAINEVPS